MIRVIRTSILVTLALLALGVRAEAYPDRPITLVQQFAPGGGSDLVARPLGQALGELLGQPIVIDSKPGANGVIANQFVSSARPDGYTLLFAAAGPMTAAPHLYSNLRIDPMAAFVPVALVVQTSFAIIANNTTNVTTLPELLALARSKPGEVTYGTSGVGGAPHLAGELLTAVTGARFLPVAYRGMGPAMTAILGGEVNFAFADIGYAVPAARDRRVKVLAVTGSRRSALLPNVPTAEEVGARGYRAGTWYGMFAPTGTPAAVIKQLNAAVNQVLARGLQKRYADQGMEPATGMTQEAFAAFVRDDYTRLGEVIRKAGIRITD